MANPSIKDLVEIPNNRVYLVSYFTGAEKEIVFDSSPEYNQFFLVMNGPPPIKLTKPEMGTKIYRIPSVADPVAFCKSLGGYLCRGKELDYLLVRNSK